MIIKLRGISYHFERHQHEEVLPDLVLLHGFMGSAHWFSELIDPLKAFCNPITVDLLGHGSTEGAELHYRFSAAEQVADISKLIQEQFAAPVFLYGYSMGARLALSIALRHPELLQGLILESGTFGIEGETERQVRQALDASRADQIMGNFSDFLANWKNLPMFERSQKLLTPSQSEIQRVQNPTWIANSLLGFGTGTMPCLREKLSGLPTATLLMVGAFDQKFIRINQTMHRELPDSKLKIIPQSGHRIHAEAPLETIHALHTFIKKNQVL